MSMPTSFAYDPFQRIKKTVRYAPQGDHETWSAYDREEEQIELSDALATNNPGLAENWSNASNMQVSDAGGGSYRVRIKTGDKEGTWYRLTPDGQGGFSVAEESKGKWDTNDFMRQWGPVIPLLAAGGVAAAQAAGVMAAGAGGALPIEGGLAAGNAIGGLGAEGVAAGAAGVDGTGSTIARTMVDTAIPQATNTISAADILSQPGFAGNTALSTPGIMETTFQIDPSGLVNAGAPEAAATTPKWVADLAAAEAMGTGAAAGEAAGSFTGSLTGAAKAGLTGIGWLDSIIEVGGAAWKAVSSLTPGQAGVIGGAAKLIGGLYMDDKSREAYADYLNRVDEWRKEDKETAEKSREDEQAFRKSEREAAEAYQKQLIEEQRAYQQKKEDEDRARRNANWNVSGISIGKPWKMKPRGGLVGNSIAIGG